MSYSQAMSHCRNHKKDRYYQQCGFSMSSDEKVESAATISKRLGAPWYIGNKFTGERLSEDFAYEDRAWDAIIAMEKDNPTMAVCLYTHGLPYYG